MAILRCCEQYQINPAAVANNSNHPLLFPPRNRNRNTGASQIRITSSRGGGWFLNQLLSIESSEKKIIQWRHHHHHHHQVIASASDVAPPICRHTRPSRILYEHWRAEDINCIRESVPKWSSTNNGALGFFTHSEISTGDVMGDMHGARLVRAVKEAAAEAGVEVEVYGVGGKRMRDAGAHLIGDNTGLSSIGLLEALPLILPSIKLQHRTRKFLNYHPPDVVVLIDYPGINIPFGKYAKQKFGCKVIYYIPPNEWLWNTSRTGAIIDSCNAILTVYPGETEYFRKSGGNVVEVGHPLLDSFCPTPTRTQAREALGYGEKDLVILLMPASRSQEVKHVWPVIASAAKLLLTRILALKSHHHVHFIVPTVVPSGDHLIKRSFKDFGLTGYASLWKGDTKRLMPAADLAITKSGSVNLELALHNVPQVVVYKLDKATAWIARNLFKFDVKYISLVNLILQEQVVPEFIQDEAEPEKVANAAFELLPLANSRHTNLSTLNSGYAKLLPLLGTPGAVKRTAQYILESISGLN